MPPLGEPPQVESTKRSANEQKLQIAPRLDAAYGEPYGLGLGSTTFRRQVPRTISPNHSSNHTLEPSVTYQETNR